MLLQWSDSLPGVTGYSVYGSTNDSIFTWYADKAADTTSWSATQLTNNTRYYWRIIAHSATGADTSLVFSDSTHCNMSGTFSIGPGGYFNSIGQALDSLPLKGMTGNVTLELQQGYSSAVETFPLVFPGNIPCRQSNYALTLRPASGTSGITVTNTTNSPLFVLDNTFNITIDGRPGGTGNLQDLTLSGLGPIIDCRNSTNNTFTFLSIQAAFPNPSGSLITLEGTAAPGSNNNTISWCDISGLSNYIIRPHTLIYSSASSGITNSNNQVVNCNLHDFTAMGIALAAGNGSWVIRNNSFYGVYGLNSDSTTAGMIAITSASQASTDSITGNYFGGTAPQCGGTVMNVIFTDTFQVITTTGNVDIRNNVIRRLAFAKLPRALGYYPCLNLINVNGAPASVSANTIGGTAAADSVSILNMYNVPLPVIGIGSKGSAGPLTVDGNTLQNIWLRTTGTTGSAGIGFGGIFTTTPASTITNNIIGDGAGASGIAGFTGEGVVGISANPAGDIQIKNNTLTGWTTQGVLTGISATSPMGVVGGNTANIIQNTVSKLTTSYTDPNGTSIYLIGGIAISQAWGTIISGNTLTALKAPGAVIGIYSTGGSSTEHIDGNFIHPIKWNGIADSVLSSSVTGIYLNSDQSLVQNNMIKLGPDSAATAIRDQASFLGIYADQGSLNEIRHNSIYIDGKGVLPGLNESACLAIFNTSSANVYNNIFVNRRSAASAGNSSFHYIIWNPSGGINTFDHNIYYFDGINSSMASYNGYVNNFATLNDWRVQTGFDGHSIFADPDYKNPGGSSAFVDLHLASPTPAEGKGDSTHTALTDFDGQLRSTLTPVDIGADAGNFVLRDAWPPVLTPDSIPNQQLDSPQVITVRITDDSGVDSTQGYGPAMWFRKFSPFASNWFYVTGSLISGSARNGVWKFTTDYSTVGLPVNAGDSFQCYFVAQDTTSLHNIGFAPLRNDNQTHPDAQDTLPTTVYKYKVIGVLPDTLWVGIGQTYTSLTNAGGAFQALNTAAAGPHGAVIVITSDLSESGTYALTGFRDTSTNTGVRIVTNTPVLKTITNSNVVTSSGLIQFVKSSNIAIDGSVGNTGKYLKFVNTNNTSSKTPCLYFGDSSTDIVVSHTILGADDSWNYTSLAYGILLEQSNANVTIDSNLIGNGTAGNTTTTGIFSDNKVANLRITNNEFYNFNRSGIELFQVGDSCLIQNNHFYFNST
ncbi:MAG TPA: hypothetical protein VG052_00490, partial [Puia sp.]|nr:hypothetical protein [Puia sp.]